MTFEINLAWISHWRLLDVCGLHGDNEKCCYTNCVCTYLYG